MDAKKKKNLEETYERILNVGFCIVPYEDISDIIGPDPMVYGTAKDERILSFEGVEALFKSQYEQMGNMKPAYERKRIALRISNSGNNACIIEELTFTLSSDKEIHTIFMRATCVMEYLDNQWKLTHWHTSTPVDTENDPWHMEEWKREKEKLQQLVDQQTAALKQNNRELQIEAALEKIRSSSLAMQKTEDLREVVKVLFEQMQGLSVDMGFASVSIFIFEDGSRNIRQWLPIPDGVSSLSVPYFDHPISSDLFDAKESGEDFFAKVYALEEKNTWLAHGFEHTDYKDLSEEFKSSLLQAPGYAIAITLAKNSGICIPSFVGKLPTPEDVEIMKRVGKVFEQAYTRFLDLQKAEVQAREARIEAALERVRSRSMAMHKTDELQEVVRVVAEELKHTGVILDTWGAVICTYFQDSKDVLHWTASEDPANPSIAFLLPYFKDELFDEAWESKEKGDSYFAKVFSFDVKNAFFKHAFEHSDYRQLPDDYKKLILDSENHGIAWAWAKNSAIMIPSIQGDLPSEDEKEILIRFAKVFEQSFIRFLDLQKAEAQAREAQIEAALERVRSKTMGMQRSEQLGETASLLFKQFDNLGIHVWSSGFQIWNADNISSTAWMSSAGGEIQSTGLRLPHTEDPYFINIYNARHNPDRFFVMESKGKELEDTYRYMFNIPEWKKAFGDIEASGFPIPKYQITHSVYFTHGYLMLITHESYPEYWDIFKRFGKVFEQTYTRFLDLQKAEAQAREAELSLALERVRAKTLAMQRSEELIETSLELWRQVEHLGIPAFGCGFNIWDPDKKFATAWMGGGERTQPPFKTDSSKDIFKRIYEAEQKGDTLFVEVQEGKAIKEHYAYMDSIPVFHKIFKEHAKTGISVPDFQIMHCSFFAQGYLMFITYRPAPEAYDIFKRFAKIFEQTYTRFLDLQKAEKQAREAQIQLALERVRARTMAMQSSEELAEVSYLLNKQVVELGIPTRGSAFNIYGETDSTEWFSNLEGTLPTYKTPRENIFLKYYESGQCGEELLIEEFGKDRIKKHYEYLQSIHVFGDDEKIVLETVNQVIPESQIDHVAYFKYGYLLFITLEPAPEAHDVFKRFAKEFEQTYTRFLDLQKAEAQAREAQIEAALERVRSKTMAMHSSVDVDITVITLFDELVKLGIDKSIRSGIGIWNQSRIVEVWTGSINPSTGQTFLDKGILDLGLHPLLSAVKDAWEAKQSTYTYELAGDNLLKYFKAVNDAPDYSIKVDFDKLPEKIIHYDFFIPDGFLFAFSPVPFSDETARLFSRFAAVFAQTYTRFLDLQRAEAQAREAKIETSLEKVRSRTMGMQSSEELPEVANLLFTEVRALGIHAWSCGYNILAEDKKSATCWMSSEGTLQTPFQLRLWGENSFNEMGEFVLSDHTMLVQELGGKALEEHYAYMKSFPDLKPTFDEIDRLGLSLPTYQINHLCKFTQGFILFITYEKVPESHAIFKRFTNVFDQTYTRFLDLQKAETQAKEARIEAALERVRSRTMGMQKAEELGEVATVLFREMNALVDNLWTCGFVLCEKNRNEDEWWLSLENGLIHPFFLPNVDDFAHSTLYEGWNKGELYRTVTLENKQLQEHYDWLMSIPIAQQIFEDMEGSGIPRPNWQRLHAAYFKTGYLVIITEVPCEEEEIFKRFAQVFDLTYTRFLDLQKAEAQAREATKQASLDRVRGVISSMRSATDLEMITPLIFRELTILGVPFIRCGVFIINEKQELVEAYLSSPDGISLGVLRLPYQASELTFQTVEAWRKGEVYKQHWNKEDFIQWINQLMEQDQIQDSSTYQGAAVPPESLDLHFVPFTQGMLYVGAVNPLDEKELELVQALAKAFSIAYARYEDFVKLEQAKAEVESAMSELKATQSQLVQQEKLASLGQLTAGIAHEIKNPLNFVNNFSEVSMEMIEEIKDERAKSQETRDETLVDEILEDIQSNLGKIHEHGSRANGIVTSMLQHSRGGSGKMEPTDLNALIKEYVNLSFHGMRAGKNPIDVDIVLDLDPKLGEVSLIKEDFTRVVINLCNNAFDAMREKVKLYYVPRTMYQEREHSDLKYLPKLRVSTLLENGRLQIAIEDNGPGIPDEIKDKIMQPFFTTKKGTEGTGLGLSITHDIIKAHGGELKVESLKAENQGHDGQGSRFTISLLQS
jgi:signal transduction histidine kinase